jgi:hypothetical protein
LAVAAVTRRTVWRGVYAQFTERKLNRPRRHFHRLADAPDIALKAGSTAAT